MILKKELILHIGYHKTGTTALQLAFSKVEAELRERGIAYPTAGRPVEYMMGHHEVPWLVTKRPGYIPSETYRDLSSVEKSARLKAIVLSWHSETSETLIISSEEFDSLVAEEIEDLMSEISDLFTVHIVMSIRNHYDFLESCFQTSVIHGNYTRSAADFFENQRSRLDYSQFIMEWLEYSSVQSLTVYNYDAAAFKGNVAKTISEDLNLDVLSNKISTGVNTRTAAPLVEIYRYLLISGISPAECKQWLLRERLLPENLNDTRHGVASFEDYFALSEKEYSNIVGLTDDRVTLKGFDTWQADLEHRRSKVENKILVDKPFNAIFQYL